MLFLVGAFTIKSAAGQANASINVLTQNSGLVNLGGTVFLQVTLNNTGPTSSIGVYKVKTQISVPSAIASIPATGHQLPTGWTITSNSGSAINLSNGTDVIAVNDSRTILIAMQGNALGGPSTVSGQLSFSNGNAPGTGPGTLAGDNTADNFSASTIQVMPAAACSIAVSASAGTILCNGGSTTLTATATGANGAVEYSLNGGAFQSGNTFTVTAAGSPYTVTAREATNTSCTATSTAVSVSQPSAVVASGSVTTTIAVAGGTGVITISATGGTSPYTGTGPFTKTAGTYSFTVTDANGCTGVTSVTINNPAACLLTAVSAVAGAAITCNGGTTTITATPTGATGSAVEYRLNAGSYQSSNIFSGVAAGTYTVTAREVSNQGCTATSSSVTIGQPTAIVASGSFSPICFGGTSTVTISATGGTGAYTGTGTFSRTAGTYNFTVTDANGCTGSVSVTVTQPAAVATPVINSVNNGNGTFTLTATGFAGTLLWSTGATTPSIIVSSAGTYTVTQTIGNCTSAVASITVSSGSTFADPAVGQMYFTTTSGAVQSANSLLLAPSAALYDINIPFYNLNQINSVPNGTIRFTVNLGSKLVLAPGFNLATAPLSTYFTWSQSVVAGNVLLTGTQIAAIPADFNSIGIFRVKGNLACKSNVVSNIVIVNTSATLVDDDLQNNAATLQYALPITVTTTQLNVSCNGAGDGKINVTASSGTTVVTTGPASFTNTQTLAAGQNTLQVAGLAPGVYTVTVTATSDPSLTGCSAATTVTIIQPAVLAASTTGTVSNTCFGAQGGSISVTSTGGSAPYTYTIIAGPTVNTSGATSGVFTGLAAGSYTIRSTDANGCTATTSGTVGQPVGGIPDLTLGSDYTGNIFTTPGVTQNIVYNISEINGNSAVGDTLRITKVAGFNITFNSAAFLTTVGSTTYTLDNARWKIDNSNPAFVSIILKDPTNTPGIPGTLFCNERVNLLVSITRVTSNISTFTLSARVRQANGETVLSNNFNSIIMTAE